MQASQVAFGGLVEAEGQPEPLLDPIDAAFRRFALSVESVIMAARAAAVRAALLAVGRLVALLRDDRLDAAPAQIGAIAARGVGLAGSYRARAGARPPDAQADLDPLQHGAKLRAVAGLARGHHERQ